MIDVPIDIQCCIAEQTCHLGTLLSLCRTSKSWRAAATPQLYRQLVFDIGASDEVDTFIACTRAGAKVHRKYIQCLTLLHAGRGGTDAWELTSTTARALRVVPKDTLRTFRCLSNMPLDDKIYTLLHAGQRKLQHMHFTVSDHFRIAALPEGLHTIDLRTSWGTDCRGILCNILDQFPQLRRLCIDNIFTENQANPAWAPFRLDQKHRRLKELSLTHFDLRGFSTQLLQIVEFGEMERFTLWECTSVSCFLDELTTAHPENNFKLMYLALGCMENAPGTPDVDSSLSAVLRRCTRLQSLQLVWGTNCAASASMALTTESLASICTLGGTLRSLGLHFLFPRQNAFDDEIRNVILACPRLQQLGIPLGSCSFESGCEFRKSDTCASQYEDLLDTLQLLRELRTLHIRPAYSIYPNSCTAIQGDLTKYPAARHSLAQELFTRANQRIWPLLTAVVVGGNGKYGRNHSCFLRTRSSLQDTDIFFEEIPEHVLRHCEPVSDIFDFEPDWDAETRVYIGPWREKRRPIGRFNDDFLGWGLDADFQWDPRFSANGLSTAAYQPHLS